LFRYSISWAWSSMTACCCLREFSSSLFLSSRVLPSSAASCRSDSPWQEQEQETEVREEREMEGSYWYSRSIGQPRLHDESSK